MSLTKHLYQFDEVVSSLQKSIRRGITNQAIFWAGELYNTNDEHAFFLFKKLFTILVEDIGLASPELVLFTWPFFVKWTDSTDRIQVDIIFIKFIKLLSLTKKNRLIANLLIYITKFDYPPNKDIIVNLDFDDFKEKYPHTSDYILEMIRKEKKSLTDSLDIFSAMVQFVNALADREYDNAYFFAHVLNQINIENYSPHQVIGHLVGKISETNVNKASIYIWGMITNKILLNEIGVQHIDKMKKKIIKRLYLLTVYGLGNSNYNLLFAITLVSNSFNVSINETSNIIESSGMNVTAFDLELFVNNRKGSIFQRRIFKIPEYALDLNTKRGRGINPKKGNRSTEYYLINNTTLPSDCTVPPINEWPPDEITKSHGIYKIYSKSNQGHIQFMQYEGNYLANYDESITDPYIEPAYQFLIDVENEKNYTYTKYTKLTKYLIEDVTRDQIYWQVFPNYYIQNNPLPFNCTEISESHLYEHEIFYDIVKVPSTNLLFSAKLCYPEGYCPVPVIVYGPITNPEILKNFEYICKLKKILDPDSNILSQPEYHILKVYPTNSKIEKECPFLIMKHHGVPLLNIISYSSESSIVQKYILLLMFYTIVSPFKSNGNNYALFHKNNEINVYDPEFADVNLSDLTEEGYISTFIKMYKDVFLTQLKLWKQRCPTNHVDCMNNLNLAISNL